MTARRPSPEGPARCGWCMTGHHRKTATSRGCTRYYGRPCPCPDPIHEEPHE